MAHGSAPFPSRPVTDQLTLCPHQLPQHRTISVIEVVLLGQATPLRGTLSRFLSPHSPRCPADSTDSHRLAPPVTSSVPALIHDARAVAGHGISRVPEQPVRSLRAPRGAPACSGSATITWIIGDPPAISMLAPHVPCRLLHAKPPERSRDK